MRDHTGAPAILALQTLVEQYPPAQATMATQRVRVDITGTRQDGNPFIIRAWAEVSQLQTPSGGLSRLCIELVQPFVFGHRPGEDTANALREARRRARRTREARARVAQELERVQFRRGLRLAREMDEEVGRRVRARTEGDDAANRDWGEGPSRWQQEAEENPNPSPWQGVADASGVELAEAPGDQAAEE